MNNALPSVSYVAACQHHNSCPAGYSRPWSSRTDMHPNPLDRLHHLLRSQLSRTYLDINASARRYQARKNSWQHCTHSLSQALESSARFVGSSHWLSSRARLSRGQRDQELCAWFSTKETSTRVAFMDDVMPGSTKYFGITTCAWCRSIVTSMAPSSFPEVNI